MHARKIDPGCLSEAHDEALAPAAVRQRILQRVGAVHGRQQVALRDALGRVLAEPGAAMGRRLGASQLGGLAAQGCQEVRVFRRPRVACLCTGDELVPLGVALGEGQIHDSNRYLLHGLLARLGVEALDLGRVPDQPVALENALRHAAEMADAIITTGGVSAGDADLTCETVARIGRLEFSRVALRPGRPMAFGRIGAAWVFSLAGKPAGVRACFAGFVADALRQLGGESPLPVRPLFEVPSAEPMRKRAGRTEYRHGVLFECQGQWRVRRSESAGGRALGMSEANCYIVLPAPRGDVAAGESVLVQTFGELA